MEMSVFLSLAFKEILHLKNASKLQIINSTVYRSYVPYVSPDVCHRCYCVFYPQHIKHNKLIILHLSILF